MHDSTFPPIAGYRPIRTLGAGGMGVVFLAEDLALARRVAVKVLSTSGDASQARFLREARAMATVEHPNVVRIYSSGQYDGGMFLVLEYVEGESLAERIRCSGPLPIDDVIRLSLEIADGLDAAAARGIVHRDVKPSNILIDVRGRAHVADFGLAKSFDTAAEAATVEALTRAGVVFGTPHYVSPEQARGEPVDVRSDIYSFGIVLYEMLTGTRPFDDLAPAALLARHLYTPLPPVTERRPDTPPRVAVLVEQMTDKDAARRPQTIADVRAALADAAAPFARWTRGSPFRGLSAFDIDDAPIFCGRARATEDVLRALRAHARDGCAFTLVLGMSGSGKSSLVRAGVVPRLIQRGSGENGVWRRAIIRPADAAGDLFDGLAVALLRDEALPELGADGTTAAALATLMRSDPHGVVPLVKGGLSQVAADVRSARGLGAQPHARLVLVVDQMEELFTIERIGADERAAFVDALAALARGGRVWILATLRSDFYARCEQLPALMALKAGAGTYHLAPPTPAEVGQMIREPARAAGLQFDTDATTGLPLDEELRDAAGQIRHLPLLEFALEQLYERRTPDGMLTHDGYRAIGGMAGALSRRAEDTFATLPSSAQARAPEVFAALVRIGGETESGFARKYAVLDALSASDRAFVDAFVDARLFVADRADDGRAVVSIAHETLLASWPRLQTWLDNNRERLRIRGRVAGAAVHWVERGRPGDLLLHEGQPFAEAQLVLNTPDLSDDERAFIEQSGARVSRSRRGRRMTTATSATFLLVIAAVYALFLWKIVPTYAAIFSSVNEELPLVVRMGIWAADAGVRYSPLLLLLVATGFVLRRRIPWPEWMRSGPALTAVAGLVFLYTVIAFLALLIWSAINLPGLYRARMVGNEALTIETLRSINSAEASYASNCARGGYAVTLEDLAKAPADGGSAFVSPELYRNGVVKNGYRIALTQSLAVRGTINVGTPTATCNGSTSAPTSGYFAGAVPVSKGSSGNLYFATDQRGVVFWSTTPITNPIDRSPGARPLP